MPHRSIIQRPELQSVPQRALFGALTALFWLLWLVLWLPLITFLAWLAFGYQLNLHMLDLGGYEAFAGLLGLYLGVIAALGGSLVLWAKYNHLRFRGMDRRKPVRFDAVASVAAAVGRDAQELRHWQSLHSMRVWHDAQGRILRIEAQSQLEGASDHGARIGP